MPVEELPNYTAADIMKMSSTYGLIKLQRFDDLGLFDAFDENDTRRHARGMPWLRRRDDYWWVPAEEVVNAVTTLEGSKFK